MRIAHVLLGRCNPESANGVDKVVYGLARAQARLRTNVCAINMTRKLPLPIPGVTVVNVAPSLVVSRIGSWVPVSPRGFSQTLIRLRPDIVHFHSSHIGPFIAVARKLREAAVPYVVTPHGAFAPPRLSTIGAAKRAYIESVEKRYLQGAAWVHAVALSDQDGLRALGIRTPILTIPNGIDFEQIPDKLDRERAIRAFPQLAGKRIFLFLGRLDPWYKGLDVLIEAFARLTVHEAALVIVGPDSRGSLATLRRHVARLGISTKVFFVGPVFGFDKWSWLASADFFVLPSRSEGAPQAALEAMAVGKPVVLSRAASTCPDATDLGLGFIADTTPEALADVLRKACSLDRAELHRMGSRARAYVVTRHSWETTAKAVIDGYHAFCTR